ncbi:MAG: SH3 domain-containing protein [Flavobacteriales bacterium]
MKKLLVLLVSVVSLNATAQDSPKHLNVLAVNGLNMRSLPDSKARIVTKVQYGKRVEVLEKTKAQLQLGWVKDHWYKVKYRGREGYIFGGYLGELSAPITSVESGLLADVLPNYCAQNFKLIGEKVNSTELQRGGDTLFHTLSRFTNSSELETEIEGSRRTSTLLLKQDVQSAYVLLQALLKTNAKPQLLEELKFVKAEDGSLSRISNASQTISIRRLSDQITELKFTSHLGDSQASVR